MNTYKKYCPNVFVAKCEEEHQSGDVITMTTKRGGNHEAVVINQVGAKGGFFYYSIIRKDGLNSSEYAKRRAEKLEKLAQNAENKTKEEEHKTANSVMEDLKMAEDYASRAEYWRDKTNKIDLSMPESIEYFGHKLEEARETHRKLKTGEMQRLHAYSITYARNEVRELEKKFDIAIRLWG